MPATSPTPDGPDPYADSAALDPHADSAALDPHAGHGPLGLRVDPVALAADALTGPIAVPLPDSTAADEAGLDRSAGTPRNGPTERGGKGRGVGPGRAAGPGRRYAFRRS